MREEVRDNLGNPIKRFRTSLIVFEKEKTMYKFIDKIQEMFEENPAGALIAAGSILAGIAKIGNMLTKARNSRTWAKEVNRRAKRSQYSRRY